MIDDRERPVFSKSEVEACLDELDCQAKLDLKICSDGIENPVKNLELLEVYCSKHLRYEKKPSGRKLLVEDELLKDSYLEEKSELKQKKELRITKIGELKNNASLKSWNDMSVTERKAVMGLDISDSELGI